MAEIRFEDITKKFGDKIILDRLNLSIEDGSFTVMIGPSGCGKTTLLRIIAGIGPQTSGKVYLDGEDISACRRQSATWRWCFKTMPSTRP